MVDSDALFSAYAEVFLRLWRLRRFDSAFLCLRRGVSRLVANAVVPCSFSLPTQRCFRRQLWRHDSPRLFSAYAEVFLDFVVSFLPGKTFLCLRRGVSQSQILLSLKLLFSLPTQRCFSADALRLCFAGLFSAYAEVFPLRKSEICSTVAFLCLRRGVSALMSFEGGLSGFSLPTQRCFPVQAD